MKTERPADVIAMYFERQGSGLQPTAVLLLDIDADRLHIRARSDCRSVAAPEDAPVLETMLCDLAADARQKDGSAILAELEDALSNSVRLSERTRMKVDDIEATLVALYAQHVGVGERVVPGKKNS